MTTLPLENHSGCFWLCFVLIFHVYFERGSHRVDQDGLRLTAIFLGLPLKCGDYRCALSHVPFAVFRIQPGPPALEESGLFLAFTSSLMSHSHPYTIVLTI